MTPERSAEILAAAKTARAWRAEIHRLRAENDQLRAEVERLTESRSVSFLASHGHELPGMCFDVGAA